MDIRAEKLAKLIVEYSIEVKAGDVVIVDTECPDQDICTALFKSIYDMGGRPIPLIRHMGIMRRMVERTDDEQLALLREAEDVFMERADSYIMIGGDRNSAEFAGLSKEAFARYMSMYRNPLSKKRLQKKWLVMRAPTPAEAQAAGMNTEDYTDLLYRACCIEYKELAKKMRPLQELMNQTDEVHIEGEGTDLTFSIRGIPAVCAVGKVNLPDGELYTAPVRNSVNGVVHFNTKTVYQGCTFDAITLTFEKGKVVKATGSNEKKLNEILDVDEGARYVGEFAFGLNPVLHTPLGNILFDEKIGGSFHLALGNCYEDAPNGNYSAIHWDLICRQREAQQQSRIFFDGRVISENGIFCISELQVLNGGC